MAQTVIQAILEADAAKPRSGTVDGTTITKRPLTELIAADRYLRGEDVVANPSGCLTFVKIIQPGTVVHRLDI